MKRLAETMTSQKLLDNLKDAGCDSETTERFLELEEAGAYQKQLRLLAKHRRRLLDCLHQEERRIDCLDYLLYQLQKRHDVEP